MDRTTRKESLSLAGLLMFGKGLSIRERFSNFRMDYIDMTNLNEEMRYSDRITYDGTWENNLYNFFRRVLNKLTTDIKKPFLLEGTQRKDDTLAHKAIREALTNSIIHADFFLSGSILRIEKHDNYLYFRNPGTLKLPIQQIYKGGSSKSRNPHIQNLLRMIGFGENLGSGFPTILDACKKEQWRKPDLDENIDLKEVTLKLWMLSMYPIEITNYLHTLLGSLFENLSPEDIDVLSIACVENEISNQRLQTLLEKNPLEEEKEVTYKLVGILHDKKSNFEKVEISEIQNLEDEVAVDIKNNPSLSTEMSITLLKMTLTFSTYFLIASTISLALSDSG